jgi:beta-phosphoglucomutase-like phosphatase (HAD superfamily)
MASRDSRRIRAVIFDLDGVIVDSEIWWHEVRVAWAAGHGRQWTHEDSRAVMGANSRGWARIMRERLDLEPGTEPEIERDIVDGIIERYHREGAPRIEGAVEAVRRIAARFPVGVASSAHGEVITAALEATELVDVIPVVVSSDEVEHGKPSPDVYLEAARRLEIPPAECLVVEDSLNGVKAAREAGMHVVLVPNETVPPAPEAFELADEVLPSLTALDPDAVERGAIAPQP